MQEKWRAINAVIKDMFLKIAQDLRLGKKIPEKRRCYRCKEMGHLIGNCKSETNESRQEIQTEVLPPSELSQKQ